MDILFHQTVVGSDILEHGRGDVLPRRVRISAKHDSALGCLEKLADPLERLRRDDARKHPVCLGRIGIEFLVSKSVRTPSKTGRNRVEGDVRSDQRLHESILRGSGDEHVVGCDACLPGVDDLAP